MAHDDTAIVTNQRAWTRLTPTLTNAGANGEVALAVARRGFEQARQLTTAFCYWTIPEGVNVVEARFLIATDNHDVDIDVWLCRDFNGTLKRACVLDVINGTGNVFGSATLHFADTINIASNEWLKTVYASVPGAELQATLIIDPCGYKYIGFHGYGTFDGDTIVEVSGC